MRRICLALVLTILVLFPAKPSSSADRFVIVGFRDKPGTYEMELVRRARGTVERTYRQIPVIAASLPEEQIARLIGADSLAYGGLDTLQKAIGFDDDECSLCTGCINYPKGVPAEMREDITKLYETDKDSSCRAYEMKG